MELNKNLKFWFGLSLAIIGVLVMALGLFGDSSILIAIVLGGFGLVLLGTSAISDKK